ncbi:MAG: SsrA-binding protein SmpB [Candidatus Omnitrophica bacterium]|nr:SsrA-binding protein SmpB [Candidatus Omnitrophota bacterium]
MAQADNPVIARNPTAGRDFTFLENFEAGIQLTGPEVKSIRAKKVNLKDSFARIEKGQAWLYGMDVSPYPQAGGVRQESKRMRRLLLHRKQIDRLELKVKEGGLTITAVKLYFKGSLIKVELALAKGKQQFDKRETIKKRELDREISRALRHRNK